MDHIFCVRCHSNLELQTLIEDGQIDEGFLHCSKCGLDFPIICKIPILWDDFTSYLSNRPSLGGELFIAAKTGKMKSFIKKTLAVIRKNPSDIGIIEKRWLGIYKTNKNSRFYSKIKSMLDMSDSILALEHGCSIGHMTQHLAEGSNFAFGTDKSFYSIMEAKKAKQKNLDFFVADSLVQPFGKTKFSLVLALNLFELIEPKPLLRLFVSQVEIDGTLVLSDPYDFERGQRSVREPIHAHSLRNELRKQGFTISDETKKPGFTPWNLKLNDRASLNYLVDIVYASKLHKKTSKKRTNSSLDNA
ncbi:MAG: methyltransferase domain-containing protein [Candidatus Nitrosotenuis sp.]